MALELGQRAVDVRGRPTAIVYAGVGHSAKGAAASEWFRFLNNPVQRAVGQRSATVTVVIETGVTGRSPGPIGSAAIASTTSIPFMTWPKIV